MQQVSFFHYGFTPKLMETTNWQENKNLWILTKDNLLYTLIHKETFCKSDYILVLYSLGTVTIAEMLRMRLIKLNPHHLAR